MTRVQLVPDDACPDCGGEGYDYHYEGSREHRWTCSTCDGSGVIETAAVAERVFGADVSRWALPVAERLYERGEIGLCSTCARFQRGRCERCEQEAMEGARVAE